MLYVFLHVHYILQSIFSLRAQFIGDDADINSLHGTASEDEVEKEMQFFFPKEQTVAVIKPNAISEKGKILQTLLTFM